MDEPNGNGWFHCGNVMVVCLDSSVGSAQSAWAVGMGIALLYAHT